MKLARPIVWTLVGVVVLVAAAVWWLPSLMGTDRARAEVERALSQALGREVTVAELVVERGAPHVEARGVTIGSGEAFAGVGPLMRAQSLTFDVGVDALVEGKVTGTVHAYGVDLHVVRRDGTTNLHGLGRRGDGAGRRVTLQLAVELEGASVVLEDRDRDESLTLEGVGVHAVLSNAADAADVGVQVRIATIDIDDVTVHDVVLGGSARDGRLTLQRIKAEVGERGRVQGKGVLDATDASWQVSATVEDVALDGPVVTAASRLYPPLALASAEGQVTGRLGASLQMSGRGLHWASVRPTLVGSGTVTFDDVTVPEGSLITLVAALGGRPPGPLRLSHASASFELADEWVQLGTMVSDGAAFDPHVRGRVALDGRLDLTVDLMPVVEAFGGGAYAQASRYTTSLPVRIEGTAQAPELKPPALEDVARGLVGAAIERALTEPPGDP